MTERISDDGEAKVVSFKLESWEYGIEISKVKEIIRMVEITPVPKAPNFVLGIIDFRGRIVPVLSLRAQLGLSSKRRFSLQTPIIITSIRGHTVGLVVDKVTAVLALESQRVEPPSQITPFSGFLKGVGRLEDRLLLLLDLDKVLTQDQKVLLEEMREKAVR